MTVYNILLIPVFKTLCNHKLAAPVNAQAFIINLVSPKDDQHLFSLNDINTL